MVWEKLLDTILGALNVVCSNESNPSLQYGLHGMGISLNIETLYREKTESQLIVRIDTVSSTR